MCSPAFPIYTIILAGISLLFSIWAIVIYSKYQKQGKRIYRNLRIIFLIICVVSLGFIFYSFLNYYYQSHYQLLEYSVELNSSSENTEVAYLPISQNFHLQSSAIIQSGSGSIQIIETVHGTALQINFTGSIRIFGSFVTTRDIGLFSLTLVNQSQYNETLSEFEIEYWMFYQPSNLFDYNCSFKIHLTHETSSSWHHEICEGYLDPGWQTYWGLDWGLFAAC